MKKIAKYQGILWLFVGVLNLCGEYVGKAYFAIGGIICIAALIGTLIFLQEEIVAKSAKAKIMYITKIFGIWVTECLVIGLTLAWLFVRFSNVDSLNPVTCYFFVSLFMVYLMFLGIMVFLAVFFGVLVTRNKPRKRTYLKTWIVILVALFLCVGIFMYYHPTYYKYNDRKIIGQEPDKVQEMYGRFDRVEFDRAGYEIDNVYLQFLFYGDNCYYWIYFQDEIATKVEIASPRGG